MRHSVSKKSHTAPAEADIDGSGTFTLDELQDLSIEELKLIADELQVEYDESVTEADLISAIVEKQKGAAG